MPVCLEGALKLKEISYIPTDAYPAGEMKHGPIALLDEDTPVVAVMNDSHVFDKVVSNVQEVRARGAARDRRGHRGQPGASHEHADWVLEIPRVVARARAGPGDPPAAGARVQASRACAGCRSTSRATSRRPSPSSSAASA